MNTININDKIRKEYDLYYDTYLRLRKIDYYTDIENPFVFEKIGNIEGKRILDIGCGPGIHINELINRNPSLIVGVDFSGEEVKICRDNFKTKNNVRIVQGDITNKEFLSDFDEKFFDLIYSVWVINHMSNEEELYSFLKNCSKYIRDDGKLLIFQGDFKKILENESSRLLGLVSNPKNLLWNEGMEVINKFENITLYDHYWSDKKIIDILKKLGFSQVERNDFYQYDESLKELNEFCINTKPFYVIIAKKSNSLIN